MKYNVFVLFFQDILKFFRLLFKGNNIYSKNAMYFWILAILTGHFKNCSVLEGTFADSVMQSVPLMSNLK